MVYNFTKTLGAECRRETGKMANLKSLNGYSGQTLDQLLSFEGEYRIDSLLAAVEQAIGQKAAREGDQNLSAEERVVLTVEALQREVNNGGHDQFFVNSSREYAPAIVDALARIGCPKTCEVTRNALDALGLDELDEQSIEAAMDAESDERDEELARCDGAYYDSGEDIDAALFAFVKANRVSIKF
jgi:uncharacterized protein DUF4375